MKKLLLLISLFSCSVLSANANEWTEPHIVERVQIDANGVYYFKVADGWGAERCKKAQYIFLRTNATAADAVLSLVLASQSTGKPIKARGVCTDSQHFQLNYVIQMEAK